MIYRFSYGTLGVVLPNFIMSISAVIWFAVILNLTRDAFIEIVGVTSDTPFQYYTITLAIALIFLIPAYKAIRWIGYVDYVAAPAILLVLIVTVTGALEMSGGILEIIKKSPATTGSVLVLLTWLHGNTVISDFTRFYKNAH